MILSRGTGLAQDEPTEVEDSAKLLLERDCRPEMHGYTWTYAFKYFIPKACNCRRPSQDGK